MQGPTGSSGVQRRENRGQASGLRRPQITSPQRQAVGFGAGAAVRSNFFSASKAASSSFRARPLLSMLPRPRQSARRGTKQRFSMAWARGLPSGRTARR